MEQTTFNVTIPVDVSDQLKIDGVYFKYGSRRKLIEALLVRFAKLPEGQKASSVHSMRKMAE